MVSNLASNNPTAGKFRSKRQEKLALKNAQSNKSFVNQTAFRTAERAYRTRIPPPDFTNVIDFANLERNTQENLDRMVKVELKHDLAALSPLFGESKGNEAKVGYTLKDFPGVVIIPRAFSPDAQKDIIKSCLRNHAKHPNLSNLDAHYEVPDDGIWSLHEKVFKGELSEDDPSCVVPLKANKDDDEDIGAYSNTPKDSHLAELPPSQLIRRLRWITCGYQYNWLEKKYALDKRFPFPEDISDIAISVAKAIEGVGHIEADGSGYVNRYEGDKYKPEAGVINYYQLKDSLMAHVDKSEINMDAPLISFSLGQSCIYLLGGATRDVPPVAIYLRSGDMMAMCGPCRAAFHGVPRILEGTLPDHLKPNPEDPDWDIYADFVNEARINVNIRQVF
ncbi:hypothetical protein K493DRAFT_207828 [Basidiobolus meristosporus CBS 931.73]|uniref:Fe2OG dioxygenase domain-containing protein n=1 Tax=Basidiobolus meristosporus CBS 931.73 TaxID=1314790 RepID=A0A1Y1YXQ7_9FUNG|nr:hypothetical protein K493DRAFT_207828 [Basidiobolus meristosporus CBS 931.73]|eukprot:ORY02811.1 hypothetical protein K493DRAFT_207828 [Basidiobolus meristosporus CBS 931.73]